MSNRRAWLVLALLVSAPPALAQEDAEITHLLDPGGDRVPLQTIVPVYPERALRDRLQGEVEVCFYVDREGQTSRIAVRRSSNRIFEKPAIQAVRASSYKPLEDNEILSYVKTCRTFRFRLDPVAIEDPPPRSDGTEP
jgi:protein TonB